jgi:hypothetical protein
MGLGGTLYRLRWKLFIFFVLSYSIAITFYVLPPFETRRYSIPRTPKRAPLLLYLSCYLFIYLIRFIYCHFYFYFLKYNKTKQTVAAGVRPGEQPRTGTALVVRHRASAHC